MQNIYEILARAAALRDETQLNSISPERAGGIMYDTLLALNDLWLQQGAALVISKIYASVAAMEADTAPVSDLTGQPLRPGQIVVIASSDSDNGSVYRYNGTDSPSWSLVGEIGNLEPVDSLDSDSTQLPLAAHQGKVLDGKISQLGQEVDEIPIVNVSQNTLMIDDTPTAIKVTGFEYKQNDGVSLEVGDNSVEIAEQKDVDVLSQRTMCIDTENTVNNEESVEIQDENNGVIFASAKTRYTDTEEDSDIEYETEDEEVVFAIGKYGVKAKDYYLNNGIDATGLMSITKGKNILFFGDSIMQGIGSPVGDDCVTIASQYLNANTMNGGIGGTRLASYPEPQTYTKASFLRVLDGLLDGDWSYVNDAIDEQTEASRKTKMQEEYTKIKALSVSDIDIIFLAYGYNSWRFGSSVDDENDKYNPLTECGALRIAVERILTANPNIKIYFATAGYSYRMSGDVRIDSTEDRYDGLNLQEYEAKVRECCQELHIPCLEQYDRNMVNQYNCDTYLADGVHRTSVGYKLLGEQYAKFLLNN